ncbi:MAG: UDP-N-acetylmuramoyl-L-alanyl-D-glutamate--2,6-diaminopimelate ligase [Myxococcales bacterium]|nr:UDP-N-acetylmuramoyl-L-alanyl-D-glutamate--2,6-diaminopimelate ligase [Myxococcales bacterium]
MSRSSLDDEARTDEGFALEDLLRELPGEGRVDGDGRVRAFGVRHDSRAVRPGDIFAVRVGERSDGRAFVASALDRGAVALLASRDLELPSDAGVPVIRVADFATGFAWSAAALYGHPTFALDVVGITGTNGKTTSSHLVRSAIDGALGREKCGLIGTVGHTYAGVAIDAEHTTPEADELARIFAVMRRRGATHCVMEVSSIALAVGRVRAVRFRVAAFTNFTQDHLDFHGTMAAYADAKRLLFTDLAPGAAVLNVDDALGAELATQARCPVLTVSPSGKGGDITPHSVRLHAGGTDLVVDTPGKRVQLSTRLVGAHNVENVLVALGVALALDLDVERAAAALAAEVGAPGRLERCDGPGDDVVVLVDYAHTPDALGRVLDAVRAVSDGARVLCVFGCGGDRDPGKRAPMGHAVGVRADVAIVTSDNPRSEDPAAIAEPVERGVREGGASRVTVREASEGARGYWVELDRARAIADAIRAARPGDVVLVAGKGHEPYQIVGDEVRAFDDREHARAALRTRRDAKEER